MSYRASFRGIGITKDGFEVKCSIFVDSLDEAKEVAENIALHLANSMKGQTTLSSKK